jgi:hypothetical protein
MLRPALTTGAVVLLGVSALGETAAADGSIGRGTVGLFGGGGTVSGGGYNARIAPWGHHYDTARYVGASGGAFVTRWLLVGGRVAWTYADGGEARSDGASLTLSMLDLGALVRIGFREVDGSTRWFFGAQGEVGGAYAWSTLRDQRQGRVIPRVGAGLFLQLFLGRVGGGISIVQRIAPWEDAGRQGVTLDLGGTEFTGSLEVRL